MRPVEKVVRITPALAGKSGMGRSGSDGGQDHPRTRGEKSYSLDINVAMGGSPPHSRGKEELGHFKHFQVGITPALAGKSVVLDD